ncbi:MAG: sigma-54-dependent Fis family transcriptional regulator, partial [Verrucomicrobiaceae bacterium]
MKQAKILLVEDDIQSRKSTEKILVLEGYEVETAENGLQAVERLKRGKESFSLILSDLRMPEMDGLEFLKALSVLGSDLPVVLMTAYGKVDEAVWAMKWGVVDFLSKPFKRQALLDSVETGLKRSPLKSAQSTIAGLSASTKNAIPRESTWLGISPQFRALSDEVERVAATQATVLITGESGSGKEQVARELHRRSVRKSQPFIVINCAALPENLLESELFGVEKGAYTGADSSRIGLFEAAHGGTLFLDEIGEMSLGLQAKMLRVLQ